MCLSLIVKLVTMSLVFASMMTAVDKGLKLLNYASHAYAYVSV